MTQCFEVYKFLTMTRQLDDDTGTFSSTGPDVWLELDEEAEQAWDSMLQPFDIDSTRLMFRLNANFRQGVKVPWAIIAFPQEYPVFEHLCSIRADRESLASSSYCYLDRPKRSDEIPLVSMIFARDITSLAEAVSTKSPLLIGAWSCLQDKATDRHWLFLAEELPCDWVKEQQQDNDES